MERFFLCLIRILEVRTLTLALPTNGLTVLQAMKLRQAVPMDEMPGYGDAVDIICGKAQSVMAASYSTISTTFVCTGHTLAFVPTGTWLQIEGTITVENDTANGTVTMNLYRTSGSAPAAGAAPTAGDSIIAQGLSAHAVASQNMGIGFEIIDNNNGAGLTPGQQYTYYVAIKSDSAAHHAIEIGNTGTGALIGASCFIVQNQ